MLVAYDAWYAVETGQLEALAWIVARQGAPFAGPRDAMQYLIKAISSGHCGHCAIERWLGRSEHGSWQTSHTTRWLLPTRRPRPTLTMRLAQTRTDLQFVRVWISLRRRRCVLPDPDRDDARVTVAVITLC
jgi:hypothetical protein